MGDYEHDDTTAAVFRQCYSAMDQLVRRPAPVDTEKLEAVLDTLRGLVRDSPLYNPETGMLGTRD